MSNKQEAPIYDPMLEGNDGKARLSWILFFQGLVAGDIGTPWTPVATNLTFTGSAPKITGAYYTNSGWTDFWISILPGVDTTATAGSTYFDLPFTIAINAPAAVTTGINSNYTGAIDSSTKRCYTPSWLSVTVPLVITGRVKA